MIQAFCLFGSVVTDVSSGCSPLIFHNPTARWSWSHHDRCETSGTAHHPTAHRHNPEVCTLRKTAVRIEHCRGGVEVYRYLATMSSALVTKSTVNFVG